MDKKHILHKVEDFTSEQLFDFINQGIVTLTELKDTGSLDHSKRKAIIDLQNKEEQKDENMWEHVRYGNETELTSYINTFPNGKYIEEAKQKIVHLKSQWDQDQVRKNEILEKIRQNSNSFTPGMIKEFLSNNKISKSELVYSGIPETIIDNLDRVNSPKLNLGDTPQSIPDGYTEVYFWGIPGSGKTCVLSGILSTAEREGYLEIANGPGYDYMTRLKNIFINPVSYLPPPSPTDSTQYLPFVLKKGKDAPRSVSLIELSGEVFQCFYNVNANKEHPSPQHKETLEILLRLLSSNNRKVHFFFIDYEKENKIDIGGLTQNDYLQAATTYFNNNDIFRNSTDVIYIVITKSDLMPCEQTEIVGNLKEYLHNANFTAFINSLRARCKEHNINGGKIMATHFSLGRVYFSQICSFNNETSKNLIDILIRRIAPNNKSLLDAFNK